MNCCRGKGEYRWQPSVFITLVILGGSGAPISYIEIMMLAASSFAVGFATLVTLVESSAPINYSTPAPVMLAGSIRMIGYMQPVLGAFVFVVPAIPFVRGGADSRAKPTLPCW